MYMYYLLRTRQLCITKLYYIYIPLRLPLLNVESDIKVGCEDQEPPCLWVWLGWHHPTTTSDLPQCWRLSSQRAWWHCVTSTSCALHDGIPCGDVLKHLAEFVPEPESIHPVTKSQVVPMKILYKDEKYKSQTIDILTQLVHIEYYWITCHYYQKITLFTCTCTCMYTHAVSNRGPTHMQEYPRIQAMKSVRGKCHWQAHMGTWNSR